jgi:16S rRNA (cytosine1402-N4)-methyltransferase
MGTGAAGGPVRHVPVLLQEIIDALEPRENGIYIDGTFGAGGTSRALLESAECIVLAIDKDPDAIAGGGELKRDSADRLTLVQGASALPSISASPPCSWMKHRAAFPFKATGRSICACRGPVPVQPMR